jgi:5-methyltetrahydrofolate--homocysteine methyltransferase
VGSRTSQHLPAPFTSTRSDSTGFQPPRNEEGDKANEGEIPLVIGFVEGDPHDLGKNIIAAIYRNYGYRLFDLGRDVSKERFVKSAQENRARVLALSAMMSTTAMIMRDIIQEVKAESPDTVVIVGGAPLDETLARSYGADGYAETAVTILEETEAAIRRVIEGKPWLSSKQS